MAVREDVCAVMPSGKKREGTPFSPQSSFACAAFFVPLNLTIVDHRLATSLIIRPQTVLPYLSA